jgi:hypothetical protein
LEELFKRPQLKHLSGYRAIGLRRLNEKLAMSLMLALHMRKRKIASVEALAEALYIGHDYIDALEWMRSPVAFERCSSKKRNDDYLLSLCGIEWHPSMKSFVFIGTSV